MGWFTKKEERLGEQYAEEMPSNMSNRQVNRMLVKITEDAELRGYNSEKADEIAGAAYRDYLVNEGRDGEYPELYEKPKGLLGKLFG